VSVVRFRSIRLNTLSVSSTGGPPAATVVPAAPVGPASGRGRRLVVEKSVGWTSPTSVHNRYVSVRYSGIQKKNDIYKNT
jgi:hypothetical protein